MDTSLEQPFAGTREPLEQQPGLVGSGGPLWLRIARSQVGTKEAPGDADNEQVLEYQRTTLNGRKPSIWLRDSVPWCSSFCNWSMEGAGVDGTGKANARSWLKWGVHCPLRIGAVAVLKRGLFPWQGHVGFVVWWDEDTVTLLGGNQRNAVRTDRYLRKRLIDTRWPAGESV